MTSFATLQDFVRLGLPATALIPPLREVEAIDVVTSRILTKGHGLIDGDIVRFEAQGTLPSPLAPLTNYEVVTIDLDLFTLKLAGSSVTLLDGGIRPFQWRADPRPMIEAALEAATATIQNHATAHSKITQPTPDMVRYTCKLAAWNIIDSNRLSLKIADQFRMDLKAQHDDIWITLRTWEKGKEIPGVIDETPTIAETGARTGGPAASPSGWGWGCGL